MCNTTIVWMYTVYKCLCVECERGSIQIRYTGLRLLLESLLLLLFVYKSGRWRYRTVAGMQSRADRDCSLHAQCV